MHTIPVVSFPNKICLSIRKFLKHFAFYRLHIFFSHFCVGAGAGAGAAKIEKSGAGATKTAALTTLM